MLSCLLQYCWKSVFSCSSTYKNCLELKQYIQKLPITIVHTKAVNSNGVYKSCQLKSGIQKLLIAMVHIKVVNCNAKHLKKLQMTLFNTICHVQQWSQKLKYPIVHTKVVNWNNTYETIFCNSAYKSDKLQ